MTAMINAKEIYIRECDWSGRSRKFFWWDVIELISKWFNHEKEGGDITCSRQSKQHYKCSVVWRSLVYAKVWGIKKGDWREDSKGTSGVWWSWRSQETSSWGTLWIFLKSYIFYLKKERKSLKCFKDFDMIRLARY